MEQTSATGWTPAVRFWQAQRDAWRAAIFLTDGDGSYDNNAQCFVDNGWPVFAIGLGGDVDEALLRQIATDTGGQYFALDTTTNIVCEFQQLRALIAGQAHGGCEPTADILQDEIIRIVQAIARYMGQATFTNTWLGSDIEMTIISPSGERYDRQTTASDAIVVVGDTFETITILEPEPGEWTVEFFGADIPDGGEPFNFSTVQLPAVPVDPTVVSPARLLESRPGEKSVDGSFEGIGRRGAGSVTELLVAGRGGVPADADAVMLNVTAVGPSGPGFLTVFPCGESRPLASNVNYVPGDVVPNAVLAKIGDGGKVCIYTLAETDIVIDVNGYVPDRGSPWALSPARLLESRAGEKSVDGSFEGIGRRGAGSVTELLVAGRGGVPADADAVMLNVTAVGPSGPGFLTVFPCGESRPLASNVNYVPGDVVPNAVLAKIGDGGKVCIYTLAETDIVIDVNGYVPDRGSPWALSPARLLESRAGEKSVDGSFEGIGRRGAGSVTELVVAGRGGVPADADAVMLNVTAVGPAGPGFLTVFPCGESRPLASNVNYVPGDVVPNAVLAKIGDGGKVCIYTLAETDIVIDVNGRIG